ncbi:P-loop containing nucleoside triphosphate hydrolase protein [Annulohypoxylon nitens]|nr:P-loop containing nucleoside triphosphate hydrolase protein [Annulohypoxylon nitens]
MGQMASKTGTKSLTHNVPNDRTQAPSHHTAAGLTVSTTPNGSQTQVAPQNQTGVYDQLSFTPPRPRQDSNRAPSSHGYYSSTVVDLEGSPSSYKSNWNGINTHTNFPNHQHPIEDEFEVPCHLTGGKAFQRHLRKPGLEIICPHLNKFLRTIIDPSSTCQGDGLLPKFSINEPYELIFYNKNKISQVQREDMDCHVREHMQALFSFIQKKSPLTWEKLNEIDERRCCEIAFKDLWLLYPPGRTVFNWDDGAWRAYKVDRVEIMSESTSEKMLVHCFFLDFDKTGKWLVPQAKTFHISPYSSERPIKSLDVIPDWYYDKLGESLIERGQLYWNYGRGVFYKRYDGDAWPRVSKEDPVNVIIDYVTSSKHQQDSGLHESHCNGAVCSICQGKAVKLESYPTDASHDSDTCGLGQTVSHVDDSTTVDKSDFLMFCPHRLWAFSLQHKSWKMVPLQELNEVESRSESFGRLIQDQNKSFLDHILRGYLENKQSSNNFSLIERKGQCLNVLLHGNPGTGKTLTVESLSEKNKIPLYRLTCSELVNDMDLERAFLRAANWGAILLVEEADMFVRTSEFDIQYRTILSSFLNKLDYSQAAVFMTANRIQGLDDALNSRLHIALPFRDLDFRAQQEIWKDAIDHLDHLNEKDKAELKDWVELGLENLDDKSYTNMNGTQIRNCISAASALAKGSMNGNLKDLHIKRMLKLGKEFEKHVHRADSSTTLTFDEMLEKSMRSKELKQAAELNAQAPR